MAVLNRRDLIQIEHVSIRDFVTNHREYLMGRVLDFGCGKPETCREPMPYRHIVDSQITLHKRGEYVPYELGDPKPIGKFDAVLLTQVIQYISDPLALLTDFLQQTKYLVMTYPTTWDEVERTDLHRFTKAGMERLLKDAGFTVLVHQARWSLPYDDFKLVGGYGVIAES